MKLRKIFAAVAATAVAASMALAASAELAFPYTAKMGFADAVWTAQDWETTAEITGNGTYTIAVENIAPLTDEETGEDYTPDVNGVTVFVVDIAKLGTDLGVDPEVEGGYDMSKCTISDVSLKAGSETIAVDNSKILWGDPEGKGNLRIEIYNAYGSTTVNQGYDESVSPLNPIDVFVNSASGDVLTLTFTISGLEEASAPAEDETPDDQPADDKPVEETPAKPNTNTGAEGIAVAAGIAVLAAGAIVVSKKRG